MFVSASPPCTINPSCMAAGITFCVLWANRLHRKSVPFTLTPILSIMVEGAAFTLQSDENPEAKGDLPTR